ncbi:MAG: Chemotaxis response regulator protein-glutamate methylesterase [Steroidobacteraceae bacterium]|nr:Chemotaxis response regulator protein-glutamate methylesterase [Steroidobacteraceae bacterium]
MPVRVLIVDDSPLVRDVLCAALAAQPGIAVVGTARDALQARQMIKQLDPDVLTLDVEMPAMDGLTFLRNLMRLRPMPVVMVSSLTTHGADTTLEALEIGAVDCLSKPRFDTAAAFDDYAASLAESIRMAARARIRAGAQDTATSAAARGGASASTATWPHVVSRVIAIGASTGGTEAIKRVLATLPADSPGIVIAQHLPGAFSAAFARRLDAGCELRVREAVDGQPLLPGHAFVAPGGRHLALVREGRRYLCRLREGPAVNRHKPSVDVLFESVAAAAGRDAIGVLLTGMGRDGAQGLCAMREAGGMTIAQDEATSVVWGMPGEAIALGAAAQVLPLGAIGLRLRELRHACGASGQHAAGR